MSRRRPLTSPAGTRSARGANGGSGIGASGAIRVRGRGFPRSDRTVRAVGGVPDPGVTITVFVGVTQVLAVPPGRAGANGPDPRLRRTCRWDEPATQVRGDLLPGRRFGSPAAGGRVGYGRPARQRLVVGGRPEYVRKGPPGCPVPMELGLHQGADLRGSDSVAVAGRACMPF